MSYTYFHFIKEQFIKFFLFFFVSTYCILVKKLLAAQACEITVCFPTETLLLYILYLDL